MKQFVLSEEQSRILSVPGETFSLSGKDYHYIIRVRRHRTNDKFTAVDARGREYECRIEKIFKNSALISGRAAGEPSQNIRSPWSITLFQCLPKGKKMDTVVRQATESGADTIIPVISRHTISRPEPSSIAKKTERWKAIGIEATQQSGRQKPPAILPPKDLTDLEEDIAGHSLSLFFHQEPLEHKGLHLYLSNIPNQGPLWRIGVIIGPEGGFSIEETSWLSEKGCKPVYLGPRVLRTETAPVYALGAIQTILLERSEWQHVSE